jgi:hypothetical protein
MKKIIFTSLFLLGCAEIAKGPPRPKNTFSRNFAIKRCYQKNDCTGPIIDNPQNGNVEIKFTPFGKGGVRGMSWRDKNEMLKDGIVFSSVINIVKHESPKKEGYFIYIMLRSGNREGRVKTFNIHDLSELNNLSIEDFPIAYKDGTLQAQLILNRPRPHAK